MSDQKTPAQQADDLIYMAGNAIARAILLGADGEEVLERIQDEVEWAVDERAAREEDAHA